MEADWGLRGDGVGVVSLPLVCRCVRDWRTVAWGLNSGCVAVECSCVGRRCCCFTAAWELRGGSVGAAWELRGSGVEAACRCVESE